MQALKNQINQLHQNLASSAAEKEIQRTQILSLQATAGDAQAQARELKGRLSRSEAFVHEANIQNVQFSQDITESLVAAQGELGPCFRT